MSIDLEQLQKVYKTTLEMLNDRKYLVSKHFKKNKPIIPLSEDLLKKYNENNCKLVLNKNKKEKITVYFYWSKVGVNEIKDLFKILQEDNVTHLLLITKDQLTSYATKEMKILGKNMETEIFYFKQLIFNITKHHIVPKHELLNEHELKLFYKNIGKKIPHIRVTDPVCRYFNGKFEQIFRIYRKNEITYRIVVPVPTNEKKKL
jgi:DNA-directed RNA polymerase I, II, and III subunit RPABC1